MAEDTLWFKRAVFYEVLVRSFKDSNGDGVGDLNGLRDRLDYLQWLGVDCLWLPPFYSSPLRDGGYDISNFVNVDPEVGTLEEFRQLLNEAHERGIKVIVDFVMNHTSDQHEWFQKSRTDPEGPYGDFYVWSDTDTLYREARVIFVDTEPSNWTWDPVRQQYYWHRFYSHQPDLNYDNPAVHEAMLDALRFWCTMGIDGFRLDAVPYLYERPGTNCENLPETHEFLRNVRKTIDAEFPGRVLLAEANQWPADVVDYFGDATSGDECHMCFHFPVMPRIFMAVRRESRYPISEILEQTPPIPANCQWGIFLRNHDELTLEMVTDDDRDYMWSEYAKDPRMKANIGIRRRLAPLLDNDVDQIQLFTALLMSLPGSPVLYYGDEIGMGDNIWLGDRDGVRTPMQWTPDRNAGFSTATPGRLSLPTVMDPVFGYQAVNVEAEVENTSSLLHWTRRMIQARKQHPAFGMGSFSDLGGSNPSVFSFSRDFGDDTVLCVNNLSRFPQPVELDLRRWEGYEPIEMIGHVRFPRDRGTPLLVDLDRARLLLVSHLPLRGGTTDVTAAFPDLVSAYFASRRWFSGKGRNFSVTQLRPLEWRSAVEPGARIEIVTVQYDDGKQDLYQFPVVYRDSVDPEMGHALVGELEHPELGKVVAYDGVYFKSGAEALLDGFHRQTADDTVSFHVLDEAVLPDLSVPGTVMTQEQSNTSIAYGEQAILKLFRRLSPGGNPDIEIHRALTQKESTHVAPLLGWIESEWQDSDGAAHRGHLGMLQTFLRTGTDGWDIALVSVRDLLVEEDLHPEEVGGDFAGEAWRLGEATAEVHADLAVLFETDTLSGPQLARLGEAMSLRLDTAMAAVPELDRVRHTASLSLCGDRRPRRPDRRTADPRRPAPGADPAHGEGLEDPRLRRRAGQEPQRAGRARLPAARRRRDAAIVRLRRRRDTAPVRHRRAPQLSGERVVRPQPGRLHRGLRERGRREAGRPPGPAPGL